MPFKDCLTIEESVSLSWDIVDDGVDWQWHDQQNMQVLTLLSALDETPMENPDEMEDCHSDFAHINLKLNVLLSMVSELLMQGNRAMTGHTIKISERMVAWKSVQQPVYGAHVDVAVLFDRCPRPLHLLGQTEHINVVAGESWVAVRLEVGSAHFFDMLGKFIFRRHRRAVALARAHPE